MKKLSSCIILLIEILVRIAVVIPLYPLGYLAGAIFIGLNAGFKDGKRMIKIFHVIRGDTDEC